MVGAITVALSGPVALVLGAKSLGYGRQALSPESWMCWQT